MAVDQFITESTYGNKVHEPLNDVNDRVCAIAKRTLEKNGKIIIPSFAERYLSTALFEGL